MSEHHFGFAQVAADFTVDATKSVEQKKLLEIELEAVGIRLNSSKPDVVFKQKTAGGVSSQRTKGATSDRSVLADHGMFPD